MYEQANFYGLSAPSRIEANLGRRRGSRTPKNSEQRMSGLLSQLTKNLVMFICRSVRLLVISTEEEGRAMDCLVTHYSALTRRPENVFGTSSWFIMTYGTETL